MTPLERWAWIEAVHDAVMEATSLEDCENLRLWWQEILNLNNQS